LAVAEMAIQTNRALHFNNVLNAVVTGVFLLLVGTIVVISIREWLLLLARRKPAELHETPPVWLPEFAVRESRSMTSLGVVTLAIALTKQLSGERQIQGAANDIELVSQPCGAHKADSHGDAASQDRTSSDIRSANRTDLSRAQRKQAYLDQTERRFQGITRCC
jgi:hypothetical protein